MNLELPGSLLTCECCGRYVKAIAIHPLMSKNNKTCHDCFQSWYEVGIVEPRLLKAHVLKEIGPYGGEANLTQQFIELMAEQGLLEKEKE